MMERLLLAARSAPISVMDGPRIVGKEEYAIRTEMLNRRLVGLVSILREVYMGRLDNAGKWRTVHELITRVQRLEGGSAAGGYIIELYVVVSYLAALEQHVDNTIEYSEIDYEKAL